jgi:predicted acetyltransferase
MWDAQPSQDGFENFLALIFGECQQSFTMVNAGWFPGSKGFYSWNGTSFVPVGMVRLRHGVAGREAEEVSIRALVSSSLRLLLVH